MKLVTWNVNSIRARLERVTAWVAANQPDVLCLQETKVVDEDFPVAPFRAAGYELAIVGERSYNGVAILSRRPLRDVTRGLGDDVDDKQARVISATVDLDDDRGPLRVITAYVPNGETIKSKKYPWKLAWLGRLRAHLDRLYTPSQPLLLCGDLNVAPEPEDVHDPAAWEHSVLHHTDVRAALAGVTAFGLTDVFRLHHEGPGYYSWWDYRLMSFNRNRGLRIDLVYVTRPLVEHSIAAEIDREERKGKLASDHAPVSVTIR